MKMTKFLKKFQKRVDTVTNALYVLQNVKLILTIYALWKAAKLGQQSQDTRTSGNSRWTLNIECGEAIVTRTRERQQDLMLSGSMGQSRTNFRFPASARDRRKHC